MKTRLFPDTGSTHTSHLARHHNSCQHCQGAAPHPAWLCWAQCTSALCSLMPCLGPGAVTSRKNDSAHSSCHRCARGNPSIAHLPESSFLGKIPLQHSGMRHSGIYPREVIMFLFGDISTESWLCLNVKSFVISQHFQHFWL